MAKFCTSCGAAVGDEQKFCNKCGSPVGSSSAPPAQASTPPPTGPPAPVITSTVAAATPAVPVAAAAAAAPKKGSSALKIIVAIVGFLALVSVLAIGSCFYIGYKVRQKARSIMEEARSSTPTSTSSTPEMHLSEGGAGSAAATTATVDVPPYPNSTPTSTGGQLSAGLTGAASAQEYLTDDPLDKVETFYKDKFGSKISIRESDGNAMFYYLSSHGMTTVTMTRDEESGKTKINIARIGK